jgi:replicative DNA helicase
MAYRAQKEELRYKVPPNNAEAEQAVLGGILIEKDAIGKVLEILSPDGADFYNDAHGRLFSAMVSLFEKNTPIDVVTLTDLFRNSSDLDGVGGVSYIGELVESTPTAANVSYYARIVKDKSLLRRIITASGEIGKLAFDEVESVDDFIDDAERMIFDVSKERSGRSLFALKDIIKDAFEMVEKLYAKKTRITGVPTGFKDLDLLTSGLQPSDLVIIAGRPSMGKTSFAVDMAEHAAMYEKIPVAVFSLEMSKEQLVQRMMASKARIELGKIRSGFLKEEDWSKLTTAVGALYEAPIYIDDTPAQSVLEIRAKARRWKTELKIGLVIVDYLQLIRGKRGADSREQEISDISRSLKALAKEIGVPVVALSQLSRRTEQREGNRPQLSDLRESGAIEQDADVVMFVYREIVYKHMKCAPGACTCDDENKRDAEIIIAKQRNGPTGNVHLTFLNEYTKFENQVRDDYGSDKTEWVEAGGDEE